jgi:hypothetical protein
MVSVLPSWMGFVLTPTVVVVGIIGSRLLAPAVPARAKRLVALSATPARPTFHAVDRPDFPLWFLIFLLLLFVGSRLS